MHIELVLKVDEDNLMIIVLLIIRCCTLRIEQELGEEWVREGRPRTLRGGSTVEVEALIANLPWILQLNGGVENLNKMLK